MTVCEECATCYWYWQNNDNENECEGSDAPCHEYIEQAKGQKLILKWQKQKI